MKSFLKTLAVILLVLCFSVAVGCKDKDYVADYSNNDMPTLGSKVETTESGSTETEQQGEDNIVDINDLLNPDKYDDEQSKNQGSSNSAKPSTGSSSTSGSSSTASSKPSSSSSKVSSSSSSQASSSSKPSSSQSTSSVENDMASGTEKDTASYNTPGWIL